MKKVVFILCLVVTFTCFAAKHSDYDLEGVNSTLQYGKDGNVMTSTEEGFKLTDKDGKPVSLEASNLPKDYVQKINDKQGKFHEFLFMPKKGIDGFTITSNKDGDLWKHVMNIPIFTPASKAVAAILAKEDYDFFKSFKVADVKADSSNVHVRSEGGVYYVKVDPSSSNTPSFGQIKVGDKTLKAKDPNDVYEIKIVNGTAVADEVNKIITITCQAQGTDAQSIWTNKIDQPKSADDKKIMQFDFQKKTIGWVDKGSSEAGKNFGVFATPDGLYVEATKTHDVIKFTSTNTDLLTITGIIEKGKQEITFNPQTTLIDKLQKQIDELKKKIEALEGGK